MGGYQLGSKTWTVLACILAVALFAAMPVLAQLPTGTILGTVKDSSGAAVPGATVTVRNTDTAATRTVTSENDGSYRLAALPTGHYELRTEKAGFQTEVEQGLTLTVAEELVLNPSLKIGTTQTEVTVTGEAPLVNTTGAQVGGLVGNQQIEDLPLNGRNYQDLTLLQPGVNLALRNGQVTALTHQVSVNGAPLRSNYYYIDGAPMVSYQNLSPSSVIGSTLGIDGIQEYKVITSGISAEYGMAMGAQMNMVSRSGTNSFHGAAFEYLRNSAISARNFFDNNASAGLNAAGQQRRIPLFIRNNFGASFGGPIQKDKTFFFFTYEGFRERLGTGAGV
jgi:hypothetical protein